MIMCGELLVSGSCDRTIKVWSTASWDCERTLEDHTRSVQSLVLCGDKLVSSSDDKSIRVWSTATWACERTIAEAHEGWVTCLAVHEGKLLSASYDKRIKVWNPTTWACERTLPAFGSGIWSLLVRGDAVFAGLDNGKIEVRSFASGELVRTLEDHDSWVNSLVVQCGELCSASADSTIKIWAP